MIPTIVFFLFQYDGKMRPSDRMPDEDLGSLPSLGEYFTYLGLGLACILAVFLLGIISDRLEDKSKVLSGFFVLLGLAALFGSWFFLLPLVAVWYTWVFVAGTVFIFFIIYSIWDHYQKKQYRRDQESAVEKWEELASFDIYPSTDKPNKSSIPMSEMLSGRLYRKTENGVRSYYVNRKNVLEFNPYFFDSSVGVWGSFQFRYRCLKDPLDEKWTYMYFNLPEDVISQVITDLQNAKSRKTDTTEIQSENIRVFEDELPF